MVKYGNQYWKQRENHGRQPLFSAEELKQACQNYLDKIRSIEYQTGFEFTRDGCTYVLNVPQKRPMNLSELYEELDISARSWHRWRTERDDLKPVINWIENEIFLYNLAGVKTNQFSPLLLNNAFYIKRLLKYECDIVSKKKALEINDFISERNQPPIQERMFLFPDKQHQRS